MAEVIGIASGLLALTGFALQSSQLLIQTLQSFQSSKKLVRNLKTELEALLKVLESEQEACNETGTGLDSLRLPVFECGKTCNELDKFIKKNAPHSDQERKSFRDWA